jgi:hypothetical protein
MNKRMFLFSGSAVFLAGCSSVSVNRDYDSTFNFSALKTYAWQHDVQPETGNPRLDNDLNDRRIRSAVERELQAKGFVKADKSKADFLIAYFMDYQQRIDSSSGSFSVGMGRSSYGRAGSVGYNTGGSVSDYEEAQLTIDFINPADEQMIWRGRGRRRASSSSKPEKITERTNDAVMRILKKFPPKK